MGKNSQRRRRWRKESYMVEPGNGQDRTPVEIPRIVITLTFQQGQLQVHGPLHDKIFMYGVLELAKQIVAQQPNEPARVIVPAIGVKVQ
jgi:hypothetical protein